MGFLAFSSSYSSSPDPELLMLMNCLKLLLQRHTTIILRLLGLWVGHGTEIVFDFLVLMLGKGIPKEKEGI